MNKNKTNKLFLAIIGLMLVSAVFLSGCGSATTNNTANKNAATNNSASNFQETYAKAPSGAVPAYYKGGQAANVIIEEFADYQCPTCAVMHPVMQQIQAAYGDRVKIVFRNFPLRTIHPKAYEAAVAVEAAGLQGKFWEMQALIFNNQQAWAPNSSDHRKLFEDYAQKIGIDVEQFKNDMAGVAAKQRVDKDIERGNALGINSTPTFFLNGKPVNYEDTEFNRFRQLIDAELLKVQQPQQQAK
jgi:Protein-disulfide isomerase